MRSTRGQRLAALLVVVAALAAVAVAAFAIGANNGSGWFGRGMLMRDHGMGWGYGPGFGLFGLVGFILAYRGHRVPERSLASARGDGARCCGARRLRPAP